MKKYSTLITFFFLLFVSAPILMNAAGTGLASSCGGGKGETDCKLEDLVKVIGNVVNFIAKSIVAPLALLMITIGGLVILLSGGSPNMVSLGKTILKTAIIGIFLTLGAWLIIDGILTAIGYQGANIWEKSWWQF